MSTISKIVGTFASAAQETTFALANFNFDLAVWKVEAPPSFQPLGAALSVHRRSVAEDGPPHIIARRLGALFAGLLPGTPNLIRAYGTRASEISQSPGINPSGSKAHGPFQDFVGIDGTSIWAAATSGPAAVAVHLLACMIAQWPPPKAVSIWQELVAERKKALIPEQEDGQRHGVEQVMDIVAANLDITKEQLEVWDASARAWLRAADGSSFAKEKQRALMKVLNSLNKQVGGTSHVYENVTTAWVTALTTVDKLVQGHPYSNAEDGAVLIAISSWHLYPDLIILGSAEGEHCFEDPLVRPGGVLTIGLQSSGPGTAPGVCWSLSLSHLRYYGGPILARTKMDYESSRLTFPEFQLVALGALIASWGLPPKLISDGALLLRQITKCLHEHIQNGNSECVWLSTFDVAAAGLLSVSDTRARPWRLVHTGHRRYRFLTRSPLSRILQLQSLRLGSVLTEIKDAIAFFRSIFLTWDDPQVPLILRVQREDCYGMFLTVTPDVSSHNTYYSYIHKSDQQRLWRSWPDTVHIYDPAGFMIDSLTITGDRFSLRESLLSNTIAPSWPFDSRSTIDFKPVIGYAGQVTLYCLDGFVDKVASFGAAKVDLATVTEAFGNDRVDPEYLSELFKYLYFSNDSICRGAMLAGAAISHASKLYECMPAATVSPKVLDTPTSISALHWTKTLEDIKEQQRKYELKELGIHVISRQDPLQPESFRDADLLRAVAFSCISYFDSGFMDPRPEHLTNVMAISSGDSLYVAASLVRDPAKDASLFEVHHILGNIGRSGMAFLIPPQNPMIRDRKAEHWELVNHDPFDGKLEDNFRSTTLHLGFTGYEAPLTSSHGGKFLDAFFIEAKVSVHDFGNWVADIDVLSAMNSPLLLHVARHDTCEQAPVVGTLPSLDLICLDNWHEILEAPSYEAVVRAHGNWQARLAAACVSVKRGHPTILFGQHGCWTCAASTAKSFEKLPSTSLQKEENLDAEEPIDHNAADVASVFIL